MKSLIIAALLPISLIANVCFADEVRDRADLRAVHDHVVEAIKELAEARAKNHYDMAGHGEAAERLLKQAEQELKLAVESAKAAQ